MAAMVNRGSYDADITDIISIFNWKSISLEKTSIDMRIPYTKFQSNELTT